MAGLAIGRGMAGLAIGRGMAGLAIGRGVVLALSPTGCWSSGT